MLCELCESNFFYGKPSEKNVLKNVMTNTLENPAITFLKESFSEGRSIPEFSGMVGAERAFFVSKIHDMLQRPILVVTPDIKQAEKFIKDLRFFSGRREKPILFFPPYNIQPFKALSYHSETAAKRISILFQLISGGVPPVVVTTVSAMLQKLVPKKEIRDFAELVMLGEELDRDNLIKKMISGGYVRSSFVEEPGDFSVRGGIVDVFSPNYPDPIRIELFGETVDALRFFSAVTQRKTEDIREAVILPAREVILKKENLLDLIGRVRKQAETLVMHEENVGNFIEKLKTEGLFPGIESLLPLIYPEPDTLFDYLPDNTCYVLSEPGELKEAAEETYQQGEKSFLAACGENRFCVEPDSLYISMDMVIGFMLQKPHLKLTTLPVSGILSGSSQFHVNVKDNTDVSHELLNPAAEENILQPLADWIMKRKKENCVTVVTCGTGPQADRIASLMEPYDIRLRLSDNFPDIMRNRGLVYVCIGHVSSGFSWPEASLAVITEDEIFGQKRRRKKVSRQKAVAELLGVEDLKKGDLLVHEEHGIGQYQGLEKLDIEGISNDFILITYKDDDRLYLPVDRMNVVKKYIGIEGMAPVLDKMGGKTWDRVKKKAKKEVEKIAKELLGLYAARKVNNGHAFGKADRYFRDFEAGFQYEETPDQYNAIDDVLDDMEKPIPMDRLVCGDVGYGKTEVALRASFKAVSDSKQVAVLVPTTILAEQHFRTFLDRFERYPVNVACMNRFRSRKEQRMIREDLKNGKTDIVIGTHRLIQKDIFFKDLGLVILDEEQRFGVKQKEKLKKLRNTVDVLALTATPIPRTLHLSLMSVRDISVISTPPEERHSIITYISEFEESLVAEAVRKELKRNGQIFFIHNNINSIQRMARKLKALVPEARFGVAHGRLDENELEDVMLSFLEKEIDVLVCTTIVESGLDIPSANTIIVNRADRFGLAQIYQLRGRVGRADEQAYAYLLIPPESILGRDAQKRLKVLMEHSDLGSGFQIAMSDLQIRGGGSALGISQSGHIAAVGYDMFLQLMEKSVSELKGEPVIEDLEPEINIPVSAYIPENYMQDIDQRLSAYRRLAKMSELSEIADFKDEIIDRYGPLPGEAASLLLKMMLKVLSMKGGVKRLDLSGQHLSLQFSEAHQKNPFGLVDMITEAPDHFRFTPDNILKVRLDEKNAKKSMAFAKNILKEIARHVNG